MITFASLFLGLIIGVHPVEVITGGPVAEIEFFLDGNPIGRRESPPWRVSCDFGERLLPHELVAVGRDAAGNELGRARQWVNLPRPPAEVGLTLAASAEGQPRSARLSWTAARGGPPRMISVLFDGRPLAVDDPETIGLPRHDPDEIHHLRAEVDFGEGHVAVSELVFGGAYADRVESEITAVPLVLQKGRRKLSPTAVSGRLVKNGTPLAIAAVDYGAVDLVIVGDTGARAALARMWQPASEMMFGVDPLRRVEFVSPVAERTEPRKTAYTLFPHSRKLVGRQARLPDALFDMPSPPAGRQRLADAVAVAGVTAAAANLRRGVLLLLSDDLPNASEIAPETARRYLQALRVPLFVWSLRRIPPAAAQAWGPIVVADDRRKLQVASRRLLQELDRQHVVWVVGRHLPQRVTLRPGDNSIRLAGVETDPR